MALRQSGIASANQSGMAVAFVLPELSKCLLLPPVSSSLPSVEICSVDVARISISKSRQARGPVHSLAGIKVAFVCRPLLGSFAHAPDLGAGLIGQVWKARGTIASGKIAV